jgi:hypothetical protein
MLRFESLMPRYWVVGVERRYGPWCKQLCLAKQASRPI